MDINMNYTNPVTKVLPNLQRISVNVLLATEPTNSKQQTTWVGRMVEVLEKKRCERNWWQARYPLADYHLRRNSLIGFSALSALYLGLRKSQGALHQTIVATTLPYFHIERSAQSNVGGVAENHHEYLIAGSGGRALSNAWAASSSQNEPLRSGSLSKRASNSTNPTNQYQCFSI
jgi:hypothetical protein